MTDVATLLKDNWNKDNTDNILPSILYDPPNSSRNYHRVVMLKDMNDHIDEIGLNRSHQNSESMDVLECEIVEPNKERMKKLFREIRRICRLKNILDGDEDYSLLDWEGGRWGGLHGRYTFTMMIYAYRSGMEF